jgi:hypothetical protein
MILLSFFREIHENFTVELLPVKDFNYKIIETKARPFSFFKRKVVFISPKENKYSNEYKLFDVLTGVCIFSDKPQRKRGWRDRANKYVCNREDKFHAILGNCIPINHPDIQSRYIAMKRLGFEEVILKELLEKYPNTKKY